MCANEQEREGDYSGALQLYLKGGYPARAAQMVLKQVRSRTRCMPSRIICCVLRHLEISAACACCVRCVFPSGLRIRSPCCTPRRAICCGADLRLSLAPRSVLNSCCVFVSRAQQGMTSDSALLEQIADALMRARNFEQVRILDLFLCLLPLPWGHVLIER